MSRAIWLRVLLCWAFTFPAASTLSAASTVWTVSSNESALAVSSGGGLSTGPQGPGSLTTKFSGTITGLVSETSISISSAAVTALDSGDWSPNEFLMPTGATANYGLKLTFPPEFLVPPEDFTQYVAMRDLSFSMTLPSKSLTPTLPNTWEFPNQSIIDASSTAYELSTGLPMWTAGFPPQVDSPGGSYPNQLVEMANLEEYPAVLRLSLPMHILLSGNSDYYVDGLLIAYATAGPGDANFDGFTDGGDYTIWADHYLQTGQTWRHGDFTGDEIVDGGDYTEWADNYSPEPAMASAIPEPSALALAGIGLVWLGSFVVRRRTVRVMEVENRTTPRLVNGQ